jgi:hypothetical protein
MSGPFSNFEAAKPKATATTAVAEGKFSGGLQRNPTRRTNGMNGKTTSPRRADINLLAVQGANGNPVTVS